MLRAAIEFAESRFARLRRRYPSLDHLVRAAIRYTDHYGDQHAAAITYFTLLSLVPLVMISFSVAGFVLAGHPELVRRITDPITMAVPGEVGETVKSIIRLAIDSRGSVGVAGILAAVYAGLGWVGNLRDALTALWALERPELPFLHRIGKDLLALVGLGLVSAVSFGVTAAGGAMTGILLRASRLGDVAVGHVLAGALAVLVSLLASWLGFLWVLAALPRRPVDTHSAVRGAVLAAIGFEVLKQVGNIYLGVLRRSPSWTPLGSLLGLFLLLLFSYLAARFLLFMTAWTATARENLHPEPVPVPPPVVIVPVVAVRHRPSFRTAAGLVGMGAVAWMGLRRILRRLKRT